MKNKKELKKIMFILPSACVAIAAVAGIMMNRQSFGKIVFPTADDQVQQEQTTESATKHESQKMVLTEKSGTWKDGTFTGSGQGFGGTIAVKVTIKKGKIITIEVTNHVGETPSYYDKAQQVIAKIMAAQSVNVDVVSGATYSSNGIRAAVAQALNKAGGKETVSVTTAKKTTSSKKTTAKEKKSKKGVPADGTFTGSATCEVFGYNVNLKVKFKQGQAVAISNFAVTNNQDSTNEKYWTMAYKPMVKKILKKQSNDVDVVSGATYSSNAVVDAYMDARNKAIEANDNTATKKAKATATPRTTKQPSVIDDVNITNTGTIQDGTYSVSALCEPDARKQFATYTLNADVVFAGQKLVSITNFKSTDETNKTYYLKAANGSGQSTGVINQLITKQSASGISAVSGATCSSKTIRQLYINALSLAGSKSLVTDEMEEVSTPAPAPTPTQSPVIVPTIDNTTKKAKDGIYRVTVTVDPDEYEDFWSYELSADVTFADNKLVSITNITLSDKTNQTYNDFAIGGTGKIAGIVTQMIEKQSNDVTTVSGATCSSKAYMQLYSEAFALACE